MKSLLEGADYSKLYESIEAQREEERSHRDKSLKQQNDDLIHQVSILLDSVIKVYEKQQKRAERLQWIITIVSSVLSCVLGYLLQFF